MSGLRAIWRLILCSCSAIYENSNEADALYPSEVEQYIHIFQTILEEDLGNIQNCVDRYTAFYRRRLPVTLDTQSRLISLRKRSSTAPLNIEEEDLLWQIQGELKSWLDRVRSRQATGYAIFWGKDIDSQEAPAVREFVRYFYNEVFLNYCQGERGILRSRLNRFKDGCEAYYMYRRNMQRIQEQEQEAVPEPVYKGATGGSLCMSFISYVRWANNICPNI